MHGVAMLLRFVAPMALAVGGDLLLHAPPCPRLIRFHLQAPVGYSLRLLACHGVYPVPPTYSSDPLTPPGADTHDGAHQRAELHHPAVARVLYNPIVAGVFTEG